MIRAHVIRAIFRRNFVSYFSSPTGYVFITVFIVGASALAFCQDSFFATNLANLDTLNRYFPYLLLFFVPAVAMATWSEERKQGTDELLLTLPARDTEVVLGKYLATLGIYTVALLFALTMIVVLLFLGSPDLGLMIATFLGYWFVGAGLLAAAMVASLLTSSMTVAFIVGMFFCAVLVFLGESEGVFPRFLGPKAASLGVGDPFSDFTRGILSLRTVVYFGALAALTLYLNLVLLARRHAEGPGHGPHLWARAASILVIGVSLGALSARSGCRVDLTAEQLYSLSSASKEIVSRIDAARPVYIHAFVSPKVPKSVVETRQNLIGLLREFDARGGNSVVLRIVETEKHSAEAREAEDQFGIKAEPVPHEEDGVRRTDELFLGAAFVCGAEQVIVPFFHRGVPIEYELTRSIGVVSGAKRRRVGIANTDARLYGGLDFTSMQSHGEWMLVSELKKQYEVAQVSLDQPLAETYDVLFVGLPSSLSQAQMDNLLAYVKKGQPTLLFDDPFPAFNPRLAPHEPKNPGRQQNPFMPPPPSEPKGDIRRFMDEIGVVWNPDAIVWDTFNPHPEYEELAKEIVFVGGKNKAAFHPQEAITSGLQEMVVIYGGEIQPRADVSANFTALLTSTPVSGTLTHEKLFVRDFFRGMVPNPNPPRRPRNQNLVLAARLKGMVPGPKEGEKPGAPWPVNVLLVPDLDCVSNQFFHMRNQAPAGLNFDNITFVLNAVDVLAGDESYVNLRKRRPRHRTLEGLEDINKKHNEDLLEKTKKAEDKAEQELKDAQARLDAKVREIENRTDIDDDRKAKEVEAVRQVEQKRLTAATREIEDRKKDEIERSQIVRDQAVKAVHKRIKALSVILPSIPPLLLAGLMFFLRLSRQGRTV
jgi:ABC-2 type transport system permease protein